ncbi:transcription factor bHLH110 isoform X1 [Coffea eugenioides]|uniref:transcription factor bHLH110 isoform X1 n=1 Tax=Coffea eugenioides TaxID=49369 RepID=UPI000F60E802|nr:transcription factor bHLH110 isoform X1 [Coffea eugenioides]XP_027147897.1 transcription factor bHLH110 isoform X1 [Coffea eugenioides]
MESTSKIPHHHRHLQQQHPLQGHQLVGSSSTSTTTLGASGFGAALGSHAWTPNTNLNSAGFGSAANTAILNSRNPRLQNDILVSSLNGSMTQDFSFSWANGSRGNNFTNQSSHDLQLEMIKREFSESYSNFSEMISSPSSSIEDVQLPIQATDYRRNENREINDPNVKLLLRSLSSGDRNNDFHRSCPGELYCSTSSSSSLGATPKRGTFSQIYPTINVSEINQTPLANSSSFHMNSQALDLLNSARFSGIFCLPMVDQLGLSKNGSLSYGYDYLSQSIPMPISEPSNITPLSYGVTETKRSDISLEPKVPQAAPKRSRSESRASCPPFKVRKEKLGDRIAALQQLVAPFGKTDTASVLMEAIGYIKFLQNQVETLSVPYLKSSRNKSSRTVHGGAMENGGEERKRDLRSRGLCLVPMSCLSYVADGGGGVWPPPSFGGGT